MEYNKLQHVLPHDILIFVDYMSSKYNKYEFTECSNDGNKYHITLANGLYTVCVV